MPGRQELLNVLMTVALFAIAVGCLVDHFLIVELRKRIEKLERDIQGESHAG